ncbi:MAG: phytanoyl-CoA dioxygenase family protein [Caldilineaceae bacterium]|nr:phytanoyl-CoA dioxygenase family protein [Caldilineaceae bacterium]
MSLTQNELALFHRQGYLVKPGLFIAADLKPLQDALTEIVDQGARELQAIGKLTNIHADKPFGQRLSSIYLEDSEAGQAITSRVMGKGCGGYNGSAMLQTIRHPALLSCIESLIGPDIVGSSVYRIRPKLPGWDRGEVPWHQDAGYTLAHCDRHLIVTCWVPLVDATLENGCLHVIPTVHRNGILKHFTGGHAGFLEVPDEELPPVEPVPVPMNAGDALLLTNLTPHASFENRTNQVRWSIDLRYQSANVPNNVDEDPAAYTPERDPVTMACYPPEADFVIRDHRDPNREIHSADQFRQLRQRYETTRPNAPGRGWTPLQER